MTSLFALTKLHLIRPGGFPLNFAKVLIAPRGGCFRKHAIAMVNLPVIIIRCWEKDHRKEYDCFDVVAILKKTNESKLTTL